MPRGGSYGLLLRAMGRASTGLSWRCRLAVATDIGARVLGVTIARLSPVLPQPILRRVSAQRWFYAQSDNMTKRDELT